MKVPIALGKGIIVSVVRLGLPADLDHLRWCEIGADLFRLERAVAWWIGDWWAFGEHHHGARREIAKDPGWQGPAYQTCANAAAVCRVFEISRRREVLSFSHHAAVAGLVPAEQDRLLDQAEREGWSRQQLRDAVRSTKPTVRVAARLMETSSCRSVTIPTTKAGDPITVSRIGKGECLPIPHVPPPVLWGAPPPALPDQAPLINPDMTKDPARRAECDLTHFLAKFENSYGAIRGVAPVIERMREAQAMLSKIVGNLNEI